MSQTRQFVSGSGKTERYLHLAYLRMGLHKGARRLWLEGRRLVDVGFVRGVRYQAAVTNGALHLRLSPQGNRVVSGKGQRPVVDLLTRELGDVERVEVRFLQGEVLVTVHPLDRARLARLERLNARLQAGEPVRLGSLSHGGGVASEAVLRGLQGVGLPAQLGFALDIDPEYLEQSLNHNPIWALYPGGVSVEADLGEVDEGALPLVEILEAGLPCVAASRAGRSKKGLRRPEEDLQVADLAAAFLDVVRATQPAVVLLENVPEYADSASADLIRRRLGRWGYELHEQVVEGLAWSLENRRRWILVALTRGLELDLGQLLQASGDRPATLGEVLDEVPLDDPSWRTFAHLAAKERRDLAKGNGFLTQLVTPESTRVPTLRRGYQKGGSTDPRVKHPTRPGYSRLLTPGEHARIKGIPPQLVEGISNKRAHQILGQSVIAPKFVAIGKLLGQAVKTA